MRIDEVYGISNTYMGRTEIIRVREVGREPESIEIDKSAMVKLYGMLKRRYEGKKSQPAGEAGWGGGGED